MAAQGIVSLHCSCFFVIVSEQLIDWLMKLLSERLTVRDRRQTLVLSTLLVAVASVRCLEMPFHADAMRTSALLLWPSSCSR